MVRLTKAHCGALFQVFQTGSLCDNCLEDRAEKAREESRGRAKPSGIIGNGGPLHERQPGIAGGPQRFPFRLNSADAQLRLGHMAQRWRVAHCLEIGQIR